LAAELAVEETEGQVAAVEVVETVPTPCRDRTATRKILAMTTAMVTEAAQVATAASGLRQTLVTSPPRAPSLAYQQETLR
jgi:hypothetical protein